MNTSTGKTDIGCRVIIESPFKSNEQYSFHENINYAIRAMVDCLQRGEAPFASHLLYTCCVNSDGTHGYTDDTENSDNPVGRVWGINAGLKWAEHADKTVVYIDNGITEGMKYGIEHAKKHNRPIEYRSLLLNNAEILAIVREVLA